MEMKGSLNTTSFRMEPVDFLIHSIQKELSLRGIHEQEHLRGVHDVHWSSAPGGR